MLIGHVTFGGGQMLTCQPILLVCALERRVLPLVERVQRDADQDRMLLDSAAMLLGALAAAAGPAAAGAAEEIGRLAAASRRPPPAPGPSPGPVPPPLPGRLAGLPVLVHLFSSRSARSAVGAGGGGSPLTPLVLRSIGTCLNHWDAPFPAQAEFRRV